MKAGTTTLFRRLANVPGMTLPDTKEPHFFSSEQTWSRGLDWYCSLFDGCDGITGEASASYSDAATAGLVSERIRGAIPTVRLLYAVRHPAERIRSHYRHEVLRSREVRPFAVAVSDPATDYVTKSLYGTVLTAFRSVFEESQILVYRLEDLDSRDTNTWMRILEHIGAENSDMPDDRYNESDKKVQFTPGLLWLWERDLLPSSNRLPSWVKGAGRRIFARRPDYRGDLLASAADQLPGPVTERLAEDLELLRSCGVDFPNTWSSA